MNRLLAALPFPAVILAIVCLWQSRQATSQSTAFLYYLGAAICLAVTFAGLRERHRKNPPE